VAPVPRRANNASVTLRRCPLLVIALIAGSCGGSPHARSVGQVERALRTAGLQPQRTTITITLERAGGAGPETPPIQEIIAMPTGQSQPPPVFTVDGGRTLVYVYPTEDAAAPYTAAPRKHVLVVRNVVAVKVHGTLSRRLRTALARLA
jgi:hypothetical protein